MSPACRSVLYNNELLKANVPLHRILMDLEVYRTRTFFLVHIAQPVNELITQQLSKVKTNDGLQSWVIGQHDLNGRTNW